MIVQLSLFQATLPATVSAFTAPAARAARARLAKLCQYCGSGNAARGQRCTVCKDGQRPRPNTSRTGPHLRQDHFYQQGTVALPGKWAG